MRRRENFTSKHTIYKGYEITYITPRYNGVVILDFEIYTTNISHLEHRLHNLFHNNVSPQFSKKMIVSVEENTNGLKQRCEVVLRCKDEKWADCVEDCKALIDKVTEPITLLCQDCSE